MNEYFILKCKGIAASGCIGGMTDKATEKIISLCADEAIDAASGAFNADGYYESDAFGGGVHEAIKAIEKRMK